MDGEALPPRGHDGPHDVLRRSAVRPILDGDVGTVAGELEGRRASNPAAPARYEGDAAVEASHGPRTCVAIIKG